jgi:hypothetical protein
VVPFVEDTSAAGSETGLLQQMKTRISRMEKDLLGIHAMAAVIKKKGEMAVEAERYTLNELQKATDSLSCKYSTQYFDSLNFEGTLSLVPELCFYHLYQS